jgi:hypothetical protein
MEAVAVSDIAHHETSRTLGLPGAAVREVDHIPQGFHGINAPPRDRSTPRAELTARWQ